MSSPIDKEDRASTATSLHLSPSLLFTNIILAINIEVWSQTGPIASQDSLNDRMAILWLEHAPAHGKALRLGDA